MIVANDEFETADDPRQRLARLLDSRKRSQEATARRERRAEFRRRVLMRIKARVWAVLFPPPPPLYMSRHWARKKLAGHIARQRVSNFEDI